MLIYSGKAAYSVKLSRIVSVLEAVRDRWGIPFNLKESGGISEDEEEELRGRIREIIPQTRGRIVSSGGNALPLSHGRRLNVENTPILLFFEDGRPVQVYPHMLGRAYVGVEEGLDLILERGPGLHEGVQGLLEPCVQRLLAGYPTMLEEGASLVGVEVDVGTGVADVVLKGGDGRTVIVEVKSHGDDLAVGQVSRIAEGYSRKMGLDAGQVRKAILCLTSSRNLVEACRGAGVELYELHVRRV